MIAMARVAMCAVSRSWPIPGTIAYRDQPRAQFVANARFSRAARRFQLLRRRVAERVAASAVAPGRERVEFFPADGKPSTGPQSELALDASARTPANCNTASAIHCKIHAAVADFASVEHQRERPAGFKATTAAAPGRQKRNREQRKRRAAQLAGIRRTDAAAARAAVR